MNAAIIEIKPHRNGWKVFEVHGVEPVFPEKAQAIKYVQNRASYQSLQPTAGRYDDRLEFMKHIVDATRARSRQR
jgi:hypothetical protein